MSIDPDWALYRTLLSVLDEGSLSAAARALGLAQPTVARHIDAPEAALGVDLFIRSQRGLEPTDLAYSLHAQARIMATTAAALLRTASGTTGEIAGTVRITASDVVGVEHLPAILTQAAAGASRAGHRTVADRQGQRPARAPPAVDRCSLACAPRLSGQSGHAGIDRGPLGPRADRLR